MSSLNEYLRSPQFTDENGDTRGESFVGRFGGNWVKSGSPRWQGYLFYIICLVGGLGLIITGGGELDIFAMFGVLCVGLAIFGGAETIRNRPFTRIFGGPAEPKE
jgi:hypothetical protein